MPWPILLLARELDQGGSERQLTLLAKTLDRNRFAPFVGCFRPDGMRRRELEQAGVPVVTFPVRSFASWSAASGAAQFARFVQRRKIRLIHAFDYPLTVFAVPLARWLTSAVAVSSQRSHRELIPPRFRRLVSLTDHVADAIVVNCDFVRRHLESDAHVPPGRIRICQNGIDLAEFGSREMQKPPGLEGAAIVIGTVCALRPEKGLSTLIEAFARLRRECDARLAIIGSGPMLGLLQVQAQSAGIAGGCLFIPATENVALWLQAMDIFVLPSLSEAFSNSLMEAMACGRCAVASRVGGNPELIQDGETGLLFPPGDPTALAQTLERLIGDKELRLRLADAAKRRIQDAFSATASASRMGEIYSELIERRARVSPGAR